MSISTKRPKLILLLLIIVSILFISRDQIKLQSKNLTKIFQPEGIDSGQIHMHGDGNTDHANPESQKRMGIYHYNEGNKFLRQNKITAAIDNYKMALHHFKNFDEAAQILTVYVPRFTQFFSVPLCPTYVAHKKSSFRLKGAFVFDQRAKSLAFYLMKGLHFPHKDL